MNAAPQLQDSSATEWIVADIGGTYARFKHWSAHGGLSADLPARYSNDDFADPAALIGRYRRDSASDSAHALLALALPVGAGQMRMTNRNWTFTVDELRAALGLVQLRVVNDFVAAAAGISTLSAAECTQIGGLHRNEGPTLVVGPGTGLGAAAILNVGAEARVIASEAGHVSAAPSGDDARMVYELARARHGRVSWERLLCGDGLALFDAVARGADNVMPPAEVAARAQAGDADARRAASAFSHALGEFAGDLSLALRATGGVYLTGGVLNGLGKAFDADALRSGFENKGRFGALLRSVPCFHVHADDLALRGLARLLEGAVRAPVFETEHH